jgi:hypothetical protein
MPILNWTDVGGPHTYSVTMSPTMGSDWIERYDHQFSQLTPTRGLIENAPGDFFVVTDDVELFERIKDSFFYRGYMRPLDMERAVAWTVFWGGRWAVTLLLGQSRAHGSTTPAEREIGTLLLPHVQHTFQQLWFASPAIDVEHERTGLHESIWTLMGRPSHDEPPA